MNGRSYDTGWTPRRSLLAALAALPLLFFSHPYLHAQGAESSAASSPETEGAQTAGEPASYAAPLPRGKKLILTDGSFQIVREYERQGDRVRYYSVERSAWEEIPADTVNWAATEKAGVKTTSMKARHAKVKTIFLILTDIDRPPS